MQTGKTNFIQEMRKKLNEYQLSKVRRMEENQKNKEFMKQENEAKDALMQYEDSLIEENGDGEYQHITGWASTRNYTGDDVQVDSERRSFSFRKNTNQVASKNFINQDEKVLKKNQMISNLKTLLKRLQSPPEQKRGLKSEGFKREQLNQKLKYQDNRHFLGAPKLNMITQKNFYLQKGDKLIQEKMALKLQKDRVKYQTLDLNAQNNPFSSKPASQYQKIKRKSSSNQYDIDIAYEKNILQQLIRGSSANKNNFLPQRNLKSSEKFTLKNLLC